MPALTSQTDNPRSPWHNVALLLLILAAFARIAWGLGSEDLWWDESLTLQRAESSLLPLLRNEILLTDGLSQVVSIDQHPFFYFLLQALLLRLAGNEEYALRFVSAAAATLMVPAAFTFSRFYARRTVFPQTSPAWAALLATISPFFLWFGQEARPYALWALLAVLSTYLLLRAVDRPRPPSAQWPWIAGYIAALLMFVTTHYYAVYMLPVHAVLVYRALRTRSKTLAALLAAAMTLAGLTLVMVAFWYVVVRQDAGDNFRHISWKILLPDLLNAFSLGLSVDISRVLWVDLLFGALALAASIWALRSRNTWMAHGWVPVAMVALPVIAILIADRLHPVYMTARHLSLIGGPFIVLVGAGLGMAWAVRPSLAIIAAAMLVAASGISTVNYFTQEPYAQDDFTRLAAELDGRLAPGDLVLIKSPFAWRIFSYYQPKATIAGMPGHLGEIDVFGAPLLNTPWPERYSFLDRVTRDHRRTWLLVSGTQAHMDLDGLVEGWLESNRYKVLEIPYFSQSSLKTHLFLPEVPVYETLPVSLPNPLDLVFGNKVRLHGYEVGDPPQSDLARPLTLYWEAETPMDRRYKYAVNLVETLEDGSQRTVSTIEQEPYMGAIPTIYWDPGKIIVEYAQLPPADWGRAGAPEDAGRFALTVQVYDAETLEKLPVTASGDHNVDEDGFTVMLPLRPQ